MLNGGTDDPIAIQCTYLSSSLFPRYNGGSLPDKALSAGSQLILVELTTSNSGDSTCVVGGASFLMLPHPPLVKVQFHLYA